MITIGLPITSTMRRETPRNAQFVLLCVFHSFSVFHCITMCCCVSLCFSMVGTWFIWHAGCREHYSLT